MQLPDARVDPDRGGGGTEELAGDDRGAAMEGSGTDPADGEDVGACGLCGGVGLFYVGCVGNDDGE